MGVTRIKSERGSVQARRGDDRVRRVRDWHHLVTPVLPPMFAQGVRRPFDSLQPSPARCHAGTQGIIRDLVQASTQTPDKSLTCQAFLSGR